MVSGWGVGVAAATGWISFPTLRGDRDRVTSDRDVFLDRGVKEGKLSDRRLRSVLARHDHVLESFLTIEADGIALARLEFLARGIRPPPVGFQQDRRPHGIEISPSRDRNVQ